MLAQINLITSSELVFKVFCPQWSESLLKSHSYFHAPAFSCDLRKAAWYVFKGSRIEQINANVKMISAHCKIVVEEG